MTSGADALIVDLEDSIAPDGKARARQSAAAFLKRRVATASRPHILVRVNGLQTGLTDADLDAIVPAKPDAIMLPKAEGGASVVHADAKLAVREAMSGLPDGHIKILAIATETAAALFRRRHICRRQRAADRPHLGRRGSFRRARRAGEPRRAGPLSRSLSAGARALPCRRRRRAVPAIDTVYVDFRDSDGFRRECEDACRDGFIGQTRDPPGAGADHQRGVHAVARRRSRARRRSSMPLQPIRRRRRRHRRRHVRPAASRAREAIAETGERVAELLAVGRCRSGLCRLSQMPDTFGIEHAFVAKFERHRAGFAERHGAIEARAAAGVAGAGTCSTLIQTASWSQSTRISTTRWVWPDVSPFFHSARRERLKYHASPVAMVFASASAFMCATISTSPEPASVATQVTSPSASNFGVSASLLRGRRQYPAVRMVIGRPTNARLYRRRTRVSLVGRAARAQA